MKTCSKCKIEKPRSEFHKQSRSSDGLREVCKTCRTEAARIHYAENKEKINAKNAEYYSKNTEKVLSRCSAYKSKNNAAIKEKAALYRKENHAQVTEARIRFRKEHPETVAAQNKKWEIAHPGHSKIRTMNRRAKRISAGGKVSDAIFDLLFAEQGGRCVYCKIDLSTVTPHLDHIMPLALNGPNTDDNMQLLCGKCNRRKGAKHPDEFARIFNDRYGQGS